MLKLWIVIAVSAVLGGCANIKVVALDTNGNQAAGAEGLRYYMPRPYLLVTRAEMPAQTKDAGTGALPPKAPIVVAPPPGAPVVPAAPAPAVPAVAAGGPAKGGDDAKTEAAPNATASASSGSDASYQHLVDNYQIKLVYLPDMSRPMAISTSAGIGSVTFQPTLVDGWMLT